MYYTIIGKTAVCPKWNVAVSIQGKYYISPNDEYEGRFVAAKCPIVENSRLPVSQQCAEYKLMRCSDSDTCKYLREFAPCVDINTGQPR